MNKPKILIVDDKSGNLFALENVLSKMDAEVIKATSGNDALKETLNHQFALAILDVQMPGMDGYELAELMRSEEKTKNIPIVFLSAVYSDEMHIFKGYQSGAVDFITKPVNPEILRHKVRVFIELDKHKNHLEELVKDRTAELQKAKEKAELANLMKSDFLSNISHELRTPLTSIVGFPNIIKDSLEKFPDIPRDELDKALHCNQIVANQSLKLLSLINDLIDLTSLDADHLTLEESPILAHSLLSSVTETYDAQAKEKQITLTSNKAELEDFYFLGDGQRLKQILGKLVENALKFTENGGVKLSVFPRGNMIICQVRDEGVGMTEEEKKVVFNRFHQLDGSSTRRYGGLGLGLDLAKGLVEKMGGSISLESRKEEGSTFTIELPRKFPAMVTETRKIIPDGTMGSFKGKKILLIEDDPDVQLLLQTDLSGNELFSAENGLDALNLLKQKRDFDVILLDRIMPVMDGDEFMKELVSQYPQVNIPIIMLTAAVSLENEHSAEKLARKLGLKFKFVVKPFTKESIMAALVELGIAEDERTKKT